MHSVVGMRTFGLDFDQARQATAAQVRQFDEIPTALDRLGLGRPQPVVVMIGGAGGLSVAEVNGLPRRLAVSLVPVLEQAGAVGLDGGTQSGVMRAFGEARGEKGASFPLLGVVAAGTVRLPGTGDSGQDLGSLEPNHSHFLVVPGQDWGDEAAWIARVATVLAAGCPSVTVIINGGEIAYSDVQNSVDAARPVVTLAGSGRTADELAQAIEGGSADPRAVALAASGMVQAVRCDDLSALCDVVAQLLRAATPVVQSEPGT